MGAALERRPAIDARARPGRGEDQQRLVHSDRAEAQRRMVDRSMALHDRPAPRRATTDAPQQARIHRARPLLVRLMPSRWFSLDHKIIGLQYAVTSMIFLLVGFGLMMLLRWQLAYPMQPIPLV